MKSLETFPGAVDFLRVLNRGVGIPRSPYNGLWDSWESLLVALEIPGPPPRLWNSKESLLWVLDFLGILND